MHSFSIELTPTFRPRPIRHVLMDWDGTTALSRTGWTELITDIYVRHLPEHPGETNESRRIFCRDELMRLNGRPSIHQMAHLADLIAARGGTPRDPAHYQEEYQHRLGELVRKRLDQVRAGHSDADALLLAGAREMLDLLRNHGIAVSLATGTPIDEVRHEAELLGVADHFEGRLFGPTDTNDRTFSKRAVIDGLLQDFSIEGASLLSFGDGPVELRETKAVGGLAVAVASDEHHNGSGRVNDWKRELLLGSGADAVIADFRHPAKIMEALTK